MGSFYSPAPRQYPLYYKENDEKNILDFSGTTAGDKEILLVEKRLRIDKYYENATIRKNGKDEGLKHVPEPEKYTNLIMNGDRFKA